MPHNNTQRIRFGRWLWLVTILAVFAVIFFLVRMVLSGSEPLVGGVKLGDGRVEIIADGFIASYLIDLDDGTLALVDAGFDTEATAIAATLQARNKTLTDIKAVFITHAHGDHIAGLKSMPAAEVYVLEADADLLEGRRVADSMFDRSNEPELTGFTADHLLADGDILEIGGTQIEVFAVPGHSRGSAAFLIHDVLFFGDSAAARSDGKITGAPPVFSADLDQNKLALVNLANHLAPRADEISVLAFGHQGPLYGLDPLLEWAAAQDTPKE